MSNVALSTPIKSPECKRAKGDESADSMELTTGENASTSVLPREQVTLEAIAGLLDQKLSPLSSLVTKLEQRVDSLEMKTTETDESIKSNFKHVFEISEQLKVRVQVLEAEVNGKSKSVVDPTIVVGGLQALGSLEAAEKWIGDELWYAWGPQPTATYAKEDFKEILFARFASVTDRDTAMGHLKSLNKHISGNKLWAKMDTPVETRAPLFLLHKAKELLTSWNIPKASLWVHADKATLTCDGELVFSVHTKDLKLDISFGEGWEDYVASEAWSKIVKDADDKLSRKRGKGSGKHEKGKPDSSQST